MTTPANWQELMGKKEPLDRELQACLAPTSLGGIMLQHPLVQEIFYSKEMNALHNEQLRLKKAALVMAWQKQDWSQYIWLHERPYRFDALVQLVNRWQQENVHVPDEGYFELLGDVWIDSENLWQMESLFPTLFNPPGRDLTKRIVMTMEHDRHILLEESAPVWTVYRGYHRFKRKLGWSWTTSPAKAVFFAKRLLPVKMSPKIAIATCARKDIIAFMQQRGECEVVIDPRKVMVVKIVGIEYDFAIAP